MKKTLMLIAVLSLMIVSYTTSTPNESKIVDASKTQMKTAYLTFDDGPSQNTEKVLKILDKYEIRATFFVIGNQIDDEYAEQLSDMEKKGHKIGIHTYTHNYKRIYSSSKAYIEDFDKTNRKLCEILKKKPDIFRFPGGSTNCFIGIHKKEIINELSNRGYIYFDWNVSGEDSVGSPTVQSIQRNVYRHYKSYNKTIILLHDSPANDETVKALPEIIEKIKEAGYVFDTLKNNKNN